MNFRSKVLDVLTATVVLIVPIFGCTQTADQPTIQELADLVSQANYQEYHLAVESMGLGLYGGADYNQGIRNRNADDGIGSLGNQEARLYLQDKFNAMQPGPSHEVARWAHENEIVVMAADNSAVEHFPLPEGMPIHQSFLRDQGGYLMELLDLNELSADKVYEFQFVVAPLNIKRGMGSPITPLAIC